ncbi:MAG: outer membrane protein assembly factor BamE [Kiloniellales bacterium]
MTVPAAAIKALMGIIMLLFVAACSQEITVRGNVADPDDVASIEPGITTRSEVARLLGSPSTVSSFRDRTWYYIGQKQTKFAFLDPDILERSVLVVQFNDLGTVEDTKLLTLEDGEYVEIVSRETPTEGREFGLLEQLLGNIGRFDAEPGGGGGASTGGSPAPGVPGL